ncbi:hypothetical protein GIB67_030803 [Kingdonia uniflora]|uniref:Nop domain-containing protein n=1 Tax=Kingdonia uniflora TaxID=39325 RepID=A0A7J7L382_9MAGN|nr:hypothetical protein GIB67_030803 [Kingdonia uniflora]
MAPTPIVVEVEDEVDEDKERYTNSKNWSSNDFINIACAYSQASQNLATTNKQKATTFWFKVRDQFNSFYNDQSMWRSYNGVNCAYKERFNKECSIFRGIIQDLEGQYFIGIGMGDVGTCCGDQVLKLTSLLGTFNKMKVEAALHKGSDLSNHGLVLQDDPKYELIIDCNALSVDIENKVIIIQNFVRDNYHLNFPELELLVHHPIDDALVVKKTGNENDLTLVDLKGCLPSFIIMVDSVTTLTTRGISLSEENLKGTIDAFDRALALDISKKVLDFVESTMVYIAPNLSAIVGTALASKLVGTAGGLSALAKMPAWNVQYLGARKKNLAGFLTVTSELRVGYVEQSEICQSTPPSLRMHACRLLAAKTALAARVDSIREDPAGTTGRNLRDEIHKKIE